MTPWNPTTPFSGCTPGSDRPGDEPSTQNPLGFVDVRDSAPRDPARDESIAYRTELSFPIRVLDAPRAEHGVPFYKREISFRRKRNSEPEPAAPPEEMHDESMADDEAFDAMRERPPVGFRAADGDDPGVAEEIDAVAEEPEGEVAEEPEAEVAEEPEDEVAEESELEAEVLAEQPEPEIEIPVGEPEVLASDAEDAVPAEEPELMSDEPGQVFSLDEEPEPDVSSDEVDPARVAEEPEPVAQVSDGGEPVEAVPMVPPRPARSRRDRRNRSRGKGRKVVGLKIGASGISAAVMANEGGRHELHELVRIPLERGVVVDGEVRDTVALERAIKALFTEFKLPKDVRIGLASNRIGVRTFDIAGIDDDERFNNAVRFKAHEVLPIAGTESVLDYRVIGTRITETGEEIRRVLLVVAPSDQVRPYVQVCREAGVRLAGIDLEALGLLRAFVHPDLARSEAAQDTATVIVGMGHESSTLLVAGGGAAEFTRVFDWGGATLQSAIAEELDVAPAEAATILTQISLAGSGDVGRSLDAEVRSKALEAVRLRLTPFARELVASLQFYQTQPESLGIGEIVMTGGTSRLEGLADFLHQMIGVPVRVGDPLARVETTADALMHVDQSELPSFTVPIGLAIEDDAMRSVNLVPQEERQDRVGRPRLAVVALPAAAAVAAIAVGGAFLVSKSGVSDRESQLQAAQAELASLPQPGGLAVVAPGVEQETAARATSIAAVLGTRTKWDRMLRDLSRVLPGDVWLTTMRAQVASFTPDSVAQAASLPAQGTAPTGVELQGYTYAQEDVATLLARLETLPSLSDVQLRWSNSAEVGKEPVVEFNIVANVRPGGTG
jgi:type IV pilus assembly protein PilM